MSADMGDASGIEYRAGRGEDWPQIAELVKDTWEDGDYINESIWREWAADGDGRLVTAVRGAQIVGCARITELGPAEWWLEGLRVGRAFRGQGIGRALMAHMLDLFTQIGIGLLRFATSNRNEAMAKLGKEFNFHPLVSYAPTEAPARAADIRNFKVLQAQNLSLAYQYLRRSPMNRVNHFAEHHWTLYYITQERLAEYLNNPDVQVLGWRQLDMLSGIAVLFLESALSDRPLRLGYLDAPDDTTALSMLQAVQGIAAKRGNSTVRWKMPLGLGLERRIEATEYHRTTDFDLQLFERPLRL